MDSNAMLLPAAILALAAAVAVLATRLPDNTRGKKKD